MNRQRLTQALQLYAFLTRPQGNGDWAYALTDWHTSWICR